MKLSVVNNGDHAALVWRPDGDPATWKPIPGCLGFAIERRLTKNGVTTPCYLTNHVGFAKGQAAPPLGEEWKWPIQRYLWWDYQVSAGDQVSYRIVPVTGTAANPKLTALGAEEGWSAPVPVSSRFSANMSAFFNRGVIATQWVEKALKAIAPAGKPRPTLMAAIADTASPLRQQLSGELRVSLLDLLANAPGDVYAALYELNDPEVVSAMTKLGGRMNLILANGAFKPPENDENLKVRKALKALGTVQVSDRLVTGSHFAHNKYFVFCDAAGNPASVFTGSTNCTLTGLCTQVNNGLAIADAQLAAAFKAEWDLLKESGDGYPDKLKTENSKPRTFPVDGAQVSVWFTPTKGQVDMKQARDLINAAKDGILFLFFNPGAFQADEANWTLLQTVVNRHADDGNPHADPNLYIRGVVNQEIDGLTAAPKAHKGMDPAAAQSPVALFDGAKTPPQHLDPGVLVPAAITKAYGDWETELKGASSVMIHSKVVVLDPFGANPVVMTGSHNLGSKASRENDDNLVIVQGHAALAQAYAANIIAIYQEYRWRDYVSRHQTDAGAWKGLQDGDAWQQGHLTKDADELMFWAGK